MAVGWVDSKHYMRENSWVGLSLQLGEGGRGSVGIFPGKFLNLRCKIMHF
jgi:hypothetical protein